MNINRDRREYLEEAVTKQMVTYITEMEEPTVENFCNLFGRLYYKSTPQELVYIGSVIRKMFGLLST